MALFLFASALFISVQSQNYSPLIGVLTLPCSDDPQDCPQSETSATSYLPSKYVKWLESGGARIIPLRVDDSFENIQKLLYQLNGVLFTGGSEPFAAGTVWWDQLDNIMSYLIQFHKNNPTEAIPLWGTCLGFEAMLSWTAGAFINVNHEAEAMMLPLQFTSDSVGNESLIFGNGAINKEYIDGEYANAVFNKLSRENITWNHHKYGVTPHSWSEHRRLNGNFSLLATSYDINGASFAAFVETYSSTGLYWYGAQFHPETIEYIFYDSLNIDHSFDTMMVNTYLSQFFVNECRIRNSNVMDAQMCSKSLIFNYAPYFINDGEYEQVYLFPKPKL